MKEVSIFLALLHLRNPKTALWYEAMAETISLERTKAAARDSDLFDKLWEMLVAKETIPANLTKEGLREKLLKADEYFTVKFDREYITVSPLQHADCVDDELRKMYWCLCSAPPKSTFITCDSPVVVRFSTGKGVAFGGAFRTPISDGYFSYFAQCVLVPVSNLKSKGHYTHAHGRKKIEPQNGYQR